MTELLATLPGHAEGIIARDPWRIQCQECGLISQDKSALIAIRRHGLIFHTWPDGTSTRLCRTCRLERGCRCENCEEERRGA